jgi:hypothetical protein
MEPPSTAGQLISDLWSFIENVTDDDPERTDKFFALRERVLNFYEAEGRTQAKSNGSEP